MSMPTSADTSASQAQNYGLGAHISGNPGDSGGGTVTATASHTWLIIVGAIAILAILGVAVFHRVRV